MRKLFYLVSSNRADFGLLKNLLFEKKNFNNIDIKLILTGTHFSKNFGMTLSEVKHENLKIFKKIQINNNDQSFSNQNKIFSNALIKFSNFFKIHRPSGVILFGDRYETLAVALACVFNNIDIIHIQGGDITKGSLDDLYRNCITKISKLHFPANQLAKKQIIRLGENPKSVFTYGSLLLDNLRRKRIISKKEIEKKFKFKFKNKNILITLHPASNEKISPRRQIRSILSSLKIFNDTFFIFTSPNPDSGHKIISKEIKRFIKKNKNSIYVKSFGQKYFFSCLKFCDCILGNSSSGVIEAPYLNVSSINVGKRQQGRPLDKSITNVDYDKKKIMKSIKKVFSEKKFFKSRNLYGKSSAAKKILRKIAQINL